MLVSIFMGVSGSGKTYYGKLVTKTLGCTFIDADSFHSEANIEKMHAGTPLTDDDRKPWLETLNSVLLNQQKKKEPTILACSMLKTSYQKLLLKGIDACIIYLEGSYEFILEGLKKRQGHFFPPSLLKSQMQLLEVPNNALVINIERPQEKILNDIVKNLKNSRFQC
jgi:carbohydrate kinase (thermoresistant glucokinase family)